MSDDYVIDYLLDTRFCETHARLSSLPPRLRPESWLRNHPLAFGFQSQVLANPLISIANWRDGASDIRRKAELSAHPGGAHDIGLQDHQTRVGNDDENLGLVETQWVPLWWVGLLTEGHHKKGMESKGINAGNQLGIWMRAF